MAAEKETMTFVERVARRASLRSSYRATFLALRQLVEDALAAGYPMKTTWETLHAEGKVTMTYETFRVHCRKAGLGRSAQEPARVRAQAKPQPSATAEPTSTVQRADERAPAFQHSRVPKKDKIYG
jgi:hypothetical protein